MYVTCGGFPNRMSYSYTPYTPIELLPCRSALTLIRPDDFSPEAGTGRIDSSDEHCIKQTALSTKVPINYFTVADLTFH